jgi:hypothetical protein
MDMTPYAIKKEKGSTAAAVRLTRKLLMMSGTIGPSMFVRNDITKNTSRTKATR